MTEFSPAGSPKKVTADSLPASSGPKPAPTHINGEKPAAPNRAQAVTGERRRRQNTGDLAGLKLYVPEDRKDPNYEYRWMNGDELRMHAKTKLDDWEPVSDSAIEGSGEGTPVSRLVGKADNGAPQRAILCRKPKEFFREDKARELAAIKEREDAIKRVGQQGAQGLSSRDNAYIPDSGENTIRQTG